MVNVTKKQKKQVEKLKKELEDSDGVYKQNKDRLSEQINKGMNVDYDITKRGIELELQEFEIKIKQGYVGFEPLRPKFSYEESKEYLEHLLEVTKFMREFKLKDLEELEEKHQKQLDRIKEQNQRIEKRRIIIIEELKELGEDTKEYETEEIKKYTG